MNILEFEVHNQKLTRLDNKVLVNKNNNIYKCQFYFEEDSDWVEENKFVIFTDGWDNKVTQHLGSEGTALSCLIPNSILNGSYFKITVCGGELLTTNNLSISLIQSGYKNHNRTIDTQGYKDMWVEVFSKLDGMVERITYSNHSINLLNKDTVLETICLPFLEEEEIRLIIHEMIVDVLPSLDGEIYTEEEKLKLSSVEYGANRTIIDEFLSLDSGNPVSNRVITNALNGKEDTYNFIDRVDDLLVELINNKD